MSKIRTSEKKEINRGRIKANPYNPKTHSDEAVRTQARNIKANGYLGGIVWNETTGNLIDGHRRLMALDMINKYDGANDYTLMVEVVHFDAQTELEQLTYMAAGGTKADMDKISEYYSKMTNNWLSGDQLQYIDELRESTEYAEMKDLTSLFIKKRDSERKKIDPNEKKRVQKEAAERMDERQFSLRRHVLIRMENDDELTEFCDAIGVNPQYDLIIEGRQILELIN